MKKILTILFISVVALAPLLADAAQVEIVTDVSETSPVYVLKYNGSEISGTTDNPYQIKIDRDLTDEGQTGDFEVYLVESNSTSPLSVDISVITGEFTTTLNGTEVSSGITPQINTVNSKVTTISAGINSNLLLYKFNLKWTGKSGLVAGTYTSDVTINYSVN